eukprot:Skav204571  [mRNA]  locus=scaffold2218:197091:209588:- [translate_table: standard]
MTGGWSSKIFHPPAGSDGRCRDVFPLPLLAECNIRDSGLSRGTRRRLLTKAAVHKRVNLALNALNSLYFGEKHKYQNTVVDDLSSLTLVQKSCIENVRKHVQLLGAPSHDARCQGAFAALRAASSSYQDIEPGVGDVVEMDITLLSLPSGKVAGVSLGQNLSGAAKDIVGQFDSFMLQDASVWTDLEFASMNIHTYNDPGLKNRCQYLEFLGRLYDCGVLSFTTEVRGRVGAFTVSKKPKIVDGVSVPRQRLVLDCRSVNLQFRSPPLTELGSLASVSDSYIPPGEQLYVATADICDCFYACNCPPGLEQYFGLSFDVTAEEALEISKSSWDGDFSAAAIWTPCFKVLPMGFNWSFYLVQVLHEQAAMDALGIDRSGVFLDGHPSPVVSKKFPSTMPYCDNVHVLSLSPEVCQEGKEKVCAKLEEMGFVLHEHTSASTLTQTLGGIIDGEVGHVRCTERRIWSLIFAFEYIAKHRVSRELVQRLLGHAMVVCTINRSGMSVFRRLYDFVHSDSPPRRLNRHEQRECTIFSGILPLLVADMRRPWSENVSATDASPEGWGICERHLPQHLVHSCGRWHERWRYRRLDIGEWRPRERALRRDVFSDPLTVRGSMHDEDDYMNYTIDESFPEVPVEFMDKAEWMTVGMGKWGDSSEHITMKEARALLLAVRRLSRASRHRGKRHLILVDNLALCFAVAKGRSSNFGILRVLQQLGSISLACGLTLRCRWVPSELNVADGPSRGQIAPGPYLKVSEATEKAHSYEDPASELCSKERQGCEGAEGQSCAEDGTSEPQTKSTGESPSRSSSSEKDQDGTSENHSQDQACRQHSSGCEGSKQEVVSPRAEEREQRSEASVRRVSRSIQGLLRGERIRLAPRSKADGSFAHGLHGRPVPRPQVMSRRREDSGGGRIPCDFRKGQASEGQKGTEGVEERNASAITTSSSKAMHAGYLNVPSYILNGALSLMGLPATFAVLLGALSDAKPIFGFHRRPYMAFGWLLIFVAVSLLVCLGLPDPYYCHTPDGTYLMDEDPCNPSARKSYVPLLSCFVLLSAGLVIANAAGDGLLVQVAKAEPAETRGQTQAMLLMFQICGQFCSSFVAAFGFNGRLFTGSFDQRDQLNFSQFVPAAMMGLVTTLIANEVADDSNCALVMGMLKSISNIGAPLASLLSNQVFGAFHPSLTERENYIKDEESFRWTVAWSYLLSYIMCLGGLSLTWLLPSQKADAQRRKREWPYRTGYAIVACVVLLVSFLYVVVGDILLLNEEMACLRFLGGTGCG